jgi:hypothetical protein
MDVTELHAEGGAALTAHGAPSQSLNLTANIPLVTGRLALRAVLYQEHRGGYIDNIHGTFAREPTDLGFSILYGGHIPADSVVLDNSALVARDFNSADYLGGRVQLKYRFGETWEALIYLR